MNTSDAEKLRSVTGGVLRPGGWDITDRGIGICGFSGQERVLDAGCGTGHTVRRLAERHRLRAWGVDISHDFLSEARAVSGDQPFVQAGLQSLPFRDQSFDAVICECVLCHTTPPVVLGEFFRVLAEGGFLVLSDLYLLEAGKGKKESPIPGLMTGREIGDTLGKYGFRIIHHEDRTRDLTYLAARLMLEYGMVPGPLFSCPAPACEGPSSWKGVGYYLLVARKENG